MNFGQLKRRVARAERLVGKRFDQATEHRDGFKREWTLAWTPGRIVVAGLLGGFLIARARPLRLLGAVSTTRWMQLAGSVSGLFASLQAAWAAQAAEGAAQDAESATDGAETAESTASPEAAGPADTPDTSAENLRVSDRRRRPDASWEAPPRPAEAATELSER